MAFDDIWAGLEEEFATPIPAAVRERYTPSATTTLAACRTCGLRFFSPATPGGPEFYELLDNGAYYNRVTWESSLVASAIGLGDDVVDFGCGDGALLRMISHRPGRSVGVDHYESAVTALRDSGIEAYSLHFEEFAQREQATFDLACAVQIVEHLPDVGPLMRAAREVLRPGGRLFIAVPNSERLRGRFEPLDYPPHHVSRWRERDLVELAARFGFEVTRILREPGTSDMYRLSWRHRIRSRLPRGRRSDGFARLLARLTPTRFLPRLLGSSPGRPPGHSLLIEMRRPMLGERPR